MQLLLILALCGAHCGIAPDSELMLGRILPGAAISILIGNIFYAWQARRLAARMGKNDITALPYGINTPSKSTARSCRKCMWSIATAAFAALRESQDRLPEAIEHWKHVAKLRALEPTGLQRLASAQVKARRLNEARETLKKLTSQEWPSRFTELADQIDVLRKQLGEK